MSLFSMYDVMVDGGTSKRNNGNDTHYFSMYDVSVSDEKPKPSPKPKPVSVARDTKPKPKQQPKAKPKSKPKEPAAKKSKPAQLKEKVPRPKVKPTQVKVKGASKKAKPAAPKQTKAKPVAQKVKSVKSGGKGSAKGSKSDDIHQLMLDYKDMNKSQRMKRLYSTGGKRDTKMFSHIAKSALKNADQLEGWTSQLSDGLFVLAKGSAEQKQNALINNSKLMSKILELE